MSDPRKTIAFDEIDNNRTTFKIDASTITYDALQVGGSAQVNKAVKLSADNTIALTTDGSMVLGKLDKVEADGFASVIDDGYVTLPGGNGAALTRGKHIVGAVDAGSAGGFIREVATGVAAELGVCDHKIIASGTATAVLVSLG